MSRIPRNYIKTSFFHVITQGINKSYIFEKAEDIKYYIKIMYQLTKEQKIKIIGYCIMSNHAHMLIEAEEINELSKYMQRLNTKYGKYYNKKYNRDVYKRQGLSRYMKDYSLLNEKRVLDLVLWEKYLVYATAFGISCLLYTSRCV